MKQITSILLLTAIFLQTFSRFVIEADYFLNKSYIAKMLCVNKEKPKMHCNGKCYLAKKLREEEKRSRQAADVKRDKFDIQPYFLPRQFAFSAFNFFPRTTYPQTDDDFSSAYTNSFFHPPSV